MMKHIKILFFAAAAFLLLGGCGDFLKEESQSEVIPKTTTDFSELLLGSGYPTTSVPDISFTSFMDDDASLFLNYLKAVDGYVEDNATVTYYPIYSWQPTLADLNGYGESKGDDPSSTAYAGFYSRIMGCNAILEYIDDARGTQAERDRIKAEALALRALYYYWLVNLYGEPYNHNKNALAVPAKLNAGIIEGTEARSTVAYIYEQVIVQDLKEAARLMDPLTIVRTDYHINQPAIHILLSRVYLHMEKYAECISEVNTAIAQGAVLLDMVNSLTTIEVINSSNGIKSYPVISYQNPEVEWLFGACPIYNGMAYCMGAMPEFQMLWDAQNDVRYFTSLLKPNEYNEIYVGKPRSVSALGQSIRTSEAYLNRMEAYALNGRESDALTELNNFRRLRITGYVNVSGLNGQALLDAIRLERRKELCYEGHRWFDLRRYGMPEIKHKYKQTKGGPVLVYTLEQGDPMYTLPFPNVVIQRNKGLTQNPSATMPTRVGVSI